MPQIAVINESTAITDTDVQKMLPAFDPAVEFRPQAGLGCR